MASARLALTAVFLVNGVMFGTLASRLPTIKGNLGLSSGRLGLALLGLAAGALLAFAAAGFLIARLGSRPVTRAAIAAEGLALVGVSLAGSLPALIGAMLALGVTNATLDVAMNAHGVAVERRRGRPILSSFHAAWSVGGLLGALIGVLMAGGGVDVRVHFALVAVVLFGAALAWSARLLPAGEDTAGAPRLLVRPPRSLVLVGVAAFCCLFAEGAAADWSAVYLDDPLGTGAGLAAAGYAAFALAMTAGRIAGDRLTVRWGPVGLLLRGGLVAGGGFGLALALDRPWAAILGFTALGLGLAPVVPTLFRAGGTTPGTPSGQGIAAVSTLGYFGLLAGPPVIGFLADAVGLPAALALVAALAGGVALLAPTVRPREAAAAPASRLEGAPSA